MAKDNVERRLAAIFAADVVSYSRLMGQDEEGTLAALNSHKVDLIGPCIEDHGGRVFKTTGDGILAEFPSVVNAVRCAVAIQEGMNLRNTGVTDDAKIIFRIGVNLGDVIPQKEDLYGDGVNIAARLEALALPGGICISGAVRDNIRDRINVATEDLGEVEVKNIVRPIRVFRVFTDSTSQDQRPLRRIRISPRARLSIIAVVAAMVVALGVIAWLHMPKPDITGPASSLSAGTSIAVLPFANLSKNPDQEYFSDGITVDLINDLSKFQDLFVIASNSAFAYKGKPVKVQAVGKELGVRYVLDGSVQKIGHRVRVIAQLVDAVSGRHLWSRRYDDSMSNIFELQDRIRNQIVRALAVKLTRYEEKLSFAKPTSDLQAYDYALRGRRLLASSRRQDNFDAERMFRAAISRDANYGSAYAGLGKAMHERVLFGWTQDPQETLENIRELAQKAIENEQSSAEGHRLLASYYLTRRNHDLALIEIEKAVALNPNNADIQATQGIILLWSSLPEGAILSIQNALRFDPQMGARPLSHLGMAYYLTKRYADAMTVLERAVNLNSDFLFGHTILTATYGQLGKKEAARQQSRIVKRLSPFFSVEEFGHLLPNASDREMIRTGLRNAGLQ